MVSEHGSEHEALEHCHEKTDEIGLTLKCLVTGGAAVPGLQRSLHVCDGICGNDLSTGIHVPSDSPPSYLHGFCRTSMSTLS